MICYHAPNPYPSKTSFFSGWFSPSSLSPKIGKLILPAQWLAPQQLNKTMLKTLVENYKILINGGFIRTHDEATLDTIEITPSNIGNSKETEKNYIIKFNGNYMLYQDRIMDLINDAIDLQACVIGFNYRGVGESKKTPHTFQNLVTDGIAQVQRLIDKGVPSHHIVLDGISLGGAIATMVAYHFHQKNQPIYLWNDRSLATMSKAAAGMLAPKLPGILGNTCEASFELTSWSAMKLTGWDVNVASAYKKIPVQYKNYMTVSKLSEKSNGDGVIKHSASLHKAVCAEEKKQGISTGHKVLAKASFLGDAPGHNYGRQYLISKNNNNKTGQDLFKEFVISARM